MATLTVSAQKAPAPQSYFYKPSQGVWVKAAPTHERELAAQGFVPVSQTRYETERFRVETTPSGTVKVGGATIVSPTEAKAITQAMEEVKTTTPSATAFEFKHVPGISPPTLTWRAPSPTAVSRYVPVYAEGKYVGYRPEYVSGEFGALVPVTGAEVKAPDMSTQVKAWQQAVSVAGITGPPVTTTTTVTTTGPKVVEFGLGLPILGKIELPNLGKIFGGGVTAQQMQAERLTQEVKGYVPKTGELFPYKGKQLSLFDVPKFDVSTEVGQKAFMEFYWAHPELQAPVTTERVGEIRYTYVSPTEIRMETLLGGAVTEVKTITAEPGKVFDISKLPIGAGAVSGAVWTTPITQEIYRFKTLEETPEYKTMQTLKLPYFFSARELGGIRPTVEAWSGIISEIWRPGSIAEVRAGFEARQYAAQFQLETAPKEWVKTEAITGGLMAAAITLPQVGVPAIVIPAKIGFGVMGVYFGTQQLEMARREYVTTKEVTPTVISRAVFGTLGVGGGSLAIRSGWQQMIALGAPKFEAGYARGEIRMYRRPEEEIVTTKEPGRIIYAREPIVGRVSPSDIEALGGYRAWAELTGKGLGTYRDIIDIGIQERMGRVWTAEFAGKGIFSTGPSKLVTDIGGGEARISLYEPRSFLGLQWYRVTEFPPFKIETGAFISPPSEQPIVKEWAGRMITYPKGTQEALMWSEKVSEAKYPQTFYQPREFLGMKWYRVTTFEPEIRIETATVFKALPEQYVQPRDYIRWMREHPMKPFEEVTQVDVTKAMRDVGGKVRVTGGLAEPTVAQYPSLQIQPTALTQITGEIGRLMTQQEPSLMISPFYGVTGKQYLLREMPQVTQLSKQLQELQQMKLEVPTTEQITGMEQVTGVTEITNITQITNIQQITELQQITQQLINITQITPITTFPTTLFPTIFGGMPATPSYPSIPQISLGGIRLGRTKRAKIRAYPDPWSAGVAQAIYGRATVPRRYSRAEVRRFEREAFTFVPPKELGGGVSRPRRRRR